MKNFDRLFVGLVAVVILALTAFAGTTNFDTVQADTAVIAPTITSTLSITGAKVFLPFEIQNLTATASTSPVDCFVGGVDTGVLTWEVPYSGSLVGISVTPTQVATLGAVYFYVYKNGVNTSFGATLATAEGASYNVQAAGLDTLVAGDKIRVKYYTTGTYNLTTVDAAVGVVVTQ